MGLNFLPRYTCTLVRVSISVMMKINDQNNLKKKEFVLSHTSTALSKAVKTKSQMGREPGGRIRCRGHEGLLFTDLFFSACSAFFLMELRNTVPVMSSPTMV